MMYYVALAVSRICCLLPAAFCEAAGRLLGEILWPFVPSKRKRMAEANVRMCLAVDEAEAQRIVKASAMRFGPMLFEVLRFPVLQKNMQTVVEIEGAEHMREGLALGRGGIIATAHSGNWELLGGALAHAGFPIVGVAMKQKEAAMDRFINDYRRMVGMHITYKSDVREMFQMLKEGWVIGLLMDQDTNRRDGVVLDFFGRATNCVPGPASLARFKDAPIFPVFITRQADGTHKVIIHKAVFVERSGDKHEDIKKTTQQLTKIIEAHVRLHPEEWFWLHDRWKSMRP